MADDPKKAVPVLHDDVRLRIALLHIGYDKKEVNEMLKDYKDPDVDAAHVGAYGKAFLQLAEACDYLGVSKEDFGYLQTLFAFPTEFATLDMKGEAYIKLDITSESDPVKIKQVVSDIKAAFQERVKLWNQGEHAPAFVGNDMKLSYAGIQEGNLVVKLRMMRQKQKAVR